MIFARSIATRLIAIVFSIYLIIALSVTLVHLVADFQDAREQVRQEIIGFHDTFDESITLALWEFDNELLYSLLQGALKIPIITGVEIQNKDGQRVMVVGEIPDRNTLYSLSHQTPLIYSGDDVPADMALGHVTLYSNDHVVFERVQVGLAFIIVNAIIKTVALWVIFLWVSKHLLRKPLEKFIAATAQLEYEEIARNIPAIATGGKHELAQLEVTFNQLVAKLHRSIGEKFKAEVILKESEERFRTLANVSPVGILYTDPEGNCLYTNSIWQVLTGQPTERALGRGWSDAVPGFDYAVLDRLKQPNAPADLFKREICMQHADGSPLWVLGLASPVRGADGGVIGFVGTITDITGQKQAEKVLKDYNQMLQSQVEERTQSLQNALAERTQLLVHQSELNERLVAKTAALRKANEQLNTLATTDSLTGVVNRREFFRLAEQELARARRYSHPTALMMMDIDHFKRVNDQYGHAIGDDALRHFTGICRQEMRSEDVIGRLGGEEFAILLPETDVESAQILAERIRASLTQSSVNTQAEPLQMSVSIGVTERAEGETQLKALLQRADSALYEAKNQGRNRVCVAS